jgi:hypothetical protein
MYCEKPKQGGVIMTGTGTQSDPFVIGGDTNNPVTIWNEFVDLLGRQQEIYIEFFDGKPQHEKIIDMNDVAPFGIENTVWIGGDRLASANPLRLNGNGWEIRNITALNASVFRGRNATSAVVENFNLLNIYATHEFYRTDIGANTAGIVFDNCVITGIFRGESFHSNDNASLHRMDFNSCNMAIDASLSATPWSFSEHAHSRLRFNLCNVFLKVKLGEHNIFTPGDSSQNQFIRSRFEIVDDSEHRIETTGAILASGLNSIGQFSGNIAECIVVVKRKGEIGNLILFRHGNITSPASPMLLCLINTNAENIMIRGMVTALPITDPNIVNAVRVSDSELLDVPFLQSIGFPAVEV